MEKDQWTGDEPVGEAWFVKEQGLYEAGMMSLESINGSIEWSSGMKDRA